MNRDILDQLGQPFPEESIGHRPDVFCPACKATGQGCPDHPVQHCDECNRTTTPAHVHLDFVGHAHVRERLNEVDPDWNWEPATADQYGRPAFDENRGLWIRLTIGGKTMWGYGDAPRARGGNAVKECIGDAIRNAAMSFGVALDMWKREPVYIPEPPPTVVSDEDQATELRRIVLGVHKKAGRKTVEAVAHFATWAKDPQADLGNASVAVLAEYREHLKRTP